MSLSRFTFRVTEFAAIAAMFFTMCFVEPANATGIYGDASMKELGRARPPIGHVELCGRLASECEGSGKKGSRIVMTAAKFDELDRINRAINTQVAPVTDLELYGVEEYWTYPVDRGDCEDYVLLKRRTLMSLGWDASTLLITVVRDLKGAGHAVLTVVTDRGDLVLDNQLEGVMPWQMTGYEYIKRQAQTSPKDWVYVGPARSDVGVVSNRRSMN